MHPSGLLRLLGNVMRLLKWGPGPEGERGPVPGMVGCGRSFPETRSGSADRDWLTRSGLESQTPWGWSGACCLGLPGERAGVRSRRACGGGRSPSAQPGWTTLSPPCYTWTNRDPELPRVVPRVPQQSQQEVSNGVPVFFSQFKGLPAALIPKNPPSPQMSLSHRQWDKIALIAS